MLLGLAVLLWGTEYKVSLYPIPLHNHLGVPQAKLLSEKERPRKADCLSSTTPRLRSWPSAHLLAIPAAIPLPRARSLSSEPSAPSSSRDQSTYRGRSMNHFFFRPPPTPAPNSCLS